MNLLKSTTATLLLFFLSASAYAQKEIIVIEKTFKVAGLGEEIFYYGFAEGDKIIFSFKELNGKDLKEVDVERYPGNSKFMEYKVEEFNNKEINVVEGGVFKFRFYNSALSGRVCKVTIKRIPKDETTEKFNTNVYWKEVFDTSYYNIPEQYLVKSDTAIVDVTNQITKVSSQTAMNGNPNRTIIDFTLPENTIKWSYYIGVGQEGKEEWDAAQDKLANQGAKMLAAINPLGALLLHGINLFSKAQGGDNVKYWFITDWDNVQLFKKGETFYQYKQGDVINDFGTLYSPLKGKIYLGLLNDNVTQAIEVVVKVTAITLDEEVGFRNVQKMSIKTRKEPYLKN